MSVYPRVYWRKDAARDSQTHNGLGLTLAYAYAKALGMRLDAALSSADNLRVTLSGLPGCTK
jgi:hypothetical protein